MNASAEAALRFARARRPVVPLHSLDERGHCTCRQRGVCGSPGKHPLTCNGLKDATSDPMTVTAWWRQWPAANVGLATGATAGLVVIDLDGEEGTETFRDLQRHHGPIPSTRWARTGSGGWHAYFAHPGGTMPNSARKLGPGIDSRGDGGFVVAPPSNHVSGGVYTWHNRERVAPMPGWLIALLRPPPPLPRPPVRLRGLNAYAGAALEHECREVASTAPGGRNHALNRAAFSLGTLVGSGQLDETTVSAALLGAALSTGLSETEAERTIRSGLSAGARQPRQVVA
ncbi:MAG: bifunctional DNA primase/polymerase [Actinomycetota bacterium]|nr:bifunctional DNA primase/polymerase [Actinomycetota bacterium]